MQDYSQFPPVRYFTRVLKGCPKSALLYAQIWKNRDKDRMHLVARKVDIRKDYIISPTMFRNLLAPLTFINLIRFKEDKDRFEIDVSGPKENE